jgi:hypothetical protein
VAPCQFGLLILIQVDHDKALRHLHDLGLMEARGEHVAGAAPFRGDHQALLLATLATRLRAPVEGSLLAEYSSWNADPAFDERCKVIVAIMQGKQEPLCEDPQRTFEQPLPSLRWLRTLPIPTFVRAILRRTNYHSGGESWNRL